MSILWKPLTWLGAAWVCLAGCSGREAAITKPPPNEHVYILPPEHDPKFNSPPAYPDKLLNQGPSKRTDPMAPPGMSGPGGRQGGPRFGAGAGGPASPY